MNDSVNQPAAGSSLSVVLAGGGTAGHVEPAMAVADALVALDPHVRITALGTARGLETRLVPERGYRLELITPVPLPRKPTGDLARLPATSISRRPADPRGAGQSRRRRGHRLRRIRVAARLPGARGVARRRRRVPVVIHEANASAGLANRVGARSAQRVLSAVPDPGLPHAEVVGVPVRAAITSLDRAALRSEARAHFGFADDARVLLVFGGSQGAASINRAVAAAAGDLAAAGVAVLHAHGAKNTIDLRTPEPGDPPYVAVPYLSRMDLAYAAADLAICRSGAMTVAEVTAVGLPAVYVPLPIGNGEQRLNALPVVNAGGGMLVADADLTPDFVADQVAGLLNDAPRLAAMTTAAALVGHPEAAQQVARVALDVARAARDGKRAKDRRSALDVARAARDGRRAKDRRSALDVARAGRTATMNCTGDDDAGAVGVEERCR